MSVQNDTSKIIHNDEEIIEPTPGQIMRTRALRHWGLMIGGIVLGIIVILALAAPIAAPHDPYTQTLSNRLLPPVWDAKGSINHILGTDQVGRDYFSRLLYGARISLMIGFATVLLSGFIGTSLGLMAGYFGGRVDLFINYLITVRLSLPGILVALATVQLIGGSLPVVIAVLGFMLWVRFAVVIRSATMQIRNMDYIKAARAAGCSAFRLIVTQILPNVLNQFVVIATLEAAHAILLEAALSFLGIGVQPPLPSWGLMINEGKDYMFFKPYLISISGIALFCLVLSINLVGDGIRDVTAPENRN